MKKTEDDPTGKNELPDPPPPTETNVALNKLIAALLPSLNKALVSAIISSGGDPWKVVVPETTVVLINEETLIGTMKGAVTYYVKDMKGLSSLVITSMMVETIKDSNTAQKVNASIPPRPVTGTLFVTAKLSKNLSAILGGSTTSSLGSLTETLALSGKATATIVIGSSKGTFTATIGYPQCCLTQLTLDHFVLDYNVITIDIANDDDVLDAYLNPIIAQYGNEIKGEVSKAVEPELNKLLKSLLQPKLCIDISKK